MDALLLSSCFLVLAGHGGWAVWIGDPFVYGWLVVGACVVSAGLCVWAGRRAGTPGVRAFWLVLAVGLVLLGVNKQLDLQTWLTVWARAFVRSQGWYGRHRELQRWFVIAVGAGAGVSVVAMLLLGGRHWRRLWLAQVGLVLTVAFVLIRAASFHHADRWLGLPVLGVPVARLLELAGPALIAAGAGLYGVRARSDNQSHPRIT